MLVFYNIVRTIVLTIKTKLLIYQKCVVIRLNIFLKIIRNGFLKTQLLQLTSR